ncbi:ankyrin repeat domain-containing protein [Chryseobacterium potabilaquae]|uniref:Ankyrin repeat-containing protein n=1 Tax=Chryseobacterium potabilaquae TaxID=2675057 RepID=A0A6N4X8X8_9FLAO|nr:ankyrin repeat domain-containing protein [Chryseobacterium potabilaquae]CAA7194843.1 hypothetical protein CHRY9293_01123 [Chryseobacterium potabilaquae]
MKKIISTILVFGIVAFTNMVFAQQMTKDQRRAFQTDNIETFKKYFSTEDYNKCFSVKTDSYSLLTYSIFYDKKNIFNYLIENQVDVNKKCGTLTPLKIAQNNNRTEMMKTLVKKGAKK